MDDVHAQLIIPTGTQVVTRTELRDAAGTLIRPRGAVGVIVAAPDDAQPAYRVRFADGGEAMLGRAELSIRKVYQRDGLELEQPSKHELERAIIYRCVIGSRAYGLDDDASDTDRRGIYLPPADLHWSLYGVPEQIEDDTTRETYWELQKFLVLALKANPNVLECLYTPLVENATPLAAGAARDAGCLSLAAGLPDLQRLRAVAVQEAGARSAHQGRGQVEARDAPDPAAAGRAISVCAKALCRCGVAEQRDRLLAIKRGEMPWEEVEAWRLELHREFEQPSPPRACPNIQTMRGRMPFSCAPAVA